MKTRICSRIIFTVSVLTILATVSSLAQLLPCVGTNGVKFLLMPQLTEGFDVKDGRQSIVLADDFQCTNSGPITDIHVWGSWSNNVPGTITNFWVGIYSDVPAGTNYLTQQVTNSHPGTLLWWTNFPQQGPNPYSWGLYTNNANEFYFDPSTTNPPTFESLVYYYCFFPSSPFYQTGSVANPTTYWLAIRAQLTNDGTYYGWKSAATSYRDPAVWGTVAGGFPIGDWQSMYNPSNPQLQLDLSMVLTTTNPTPSLPPPTVSQGGGSININGNWLNTANGTNTIFSGGGSLNWTNIVSTNPPPLISVITGAVYYTNLTYLGAYPLVDFDCWTLGCVADGTGEENLFQAMGPYFHLLRTTTVLDQFSNQLGSFTTTVDVAFSSPSNFAANVNIQGSYGGPAGFIDPTNWMQVSGYDMLLHQSDPNTIVGNYTQTILLTNGSVLLDVVTNTWTYPTGGGPGLALDELDNVEIDSLVWNPANSSLSFNGKGQYGSGQTTCTEGSGVKYVQTPQLTNGFDLWDCSVSPPVVTDGPFYLADDFKCTNSGPITDIHLWGSWLNDWWVTNAITFYLALYDDVPVSATNAFSHPGNLKYATNFVPGQYAEEPVAVGQESFLDPTASQNAAYVGPDTKVWYYCFYPANWYQYGSITNKQTYWLAAFAQMPTWVTTNVFGWKTTTNVQHDVSVHAPWPGFPPGPGFYPVWTPNYYYSTPYYMSNDLAFKINTSTNFTPTSCCPETNLIKYAQYPDVNYGVDVDASFNPYDYCSPNAVGWMLADDFPCTNSGPITDIHLWGSWFNDQVDPNATFVLGIWSDVPTNATVPSSHPGTQLWSQAYGPNQFNFCQTNLVEHFEDALGLPLSPDCYMPTFTTNLYHLCFAVPPPFNPTNIFYQTGSVTAKTNYWLSVTVIGSNGTNYFGWKSSATAYGDYAVGSSSGAFPPTAWDTIIHNSSNNPLNMAFMIGMATNQCTTPPQLLSTNLTVSCTNTAWQPPVPPVLDPCCTPPGTPSMTGSNIIATCPTVYQFKWQYTNCQAQVAYGFTFVTVTSAPPVLIPTNVMINCCTPTPTNPPQVYDQCCSGIVPFQVNSWTNGAGCGSVIYQVWKAVDCYCTNLTATVTQTVTVVSALNLQCSNFTVTCGSPIPTNPPAWTDPCCTNVNVFPLPSTTTTNGCVRTISQIWEAVDACGCTALCTQLITVVPPLSSAVVVPNANTYVAGNGGNGYPFDITPWGYSYMRHQQVYAASQFGAMPPGGAYITAIVFRMAQGGTHGFSTTLPAVQLDLSTTTKAPDALDATFANNVGADDRTVYPSGPLPLSTADTGNPAPFDIVIPLATPFFYNPAAGNLLLDVRNTGAGTTAVFDAVNTLGDSVSRLYTTVSGNPTGAADTTGLITEFIMGPPLQLQCSNLTITCGMLVPTNPPACISLCCSNPTITMVSGFTNISGCGNGGYISQTWQAVDCCGNVTNCTRLITVLPSPPTLVCSNWVLSCGSPVPTNRPTWIDLCCTNVTVALLSSTTNCTDSGSIITRLWWAIDCCTNSTTCTQTVTLLCPLKYTQWPDVNNGYDVWNSSTNAGLHSDGPWVLADDFVCTNTGYITDIHLWGSWAYDFVATNQLTFWIGVFDDVPAVTNTVGQVITNSHPGGLKWSQCFPPFTYCESYWSPATEGFLDPGPPAQIGSDSQVWYYCFSPATSPIQWGSATTPRTYWVAATAQLPATYANSNYLFGWKSTTNVQHDASVHSPWLLGMCPTNIPQTAFAWVPTRRANNTNSLDLAFEISTTTNCSPFVTIEKLSATTVRVSWPSGGVLQWSTNVIGPYVDVPPGPPLGPTSPFIDTSFPPPPLDRFYRVRCN